VFGKTNRNNDKNKAINIDLDKILNRKYLNKYLQRKSIKIQINILFYQKITFYLVSFTYSKEQFLDSPRTLQPA